MVHQGINMSTKTKPQRKRYAAEYKFERIAAFNNLIDAGREYAKDGRRAAKKMREVWTKRSMRPGDMHKPQPAAPCLITRGAA